MAEQINREGETVLTEIDIESYDGSKKMSIVNQFQTMNIYESILSPIVVADLYMLDAIGLYETFPITGDEYVTVEFKTAGSDKPIKYRLKVTQVSDRAIAESASNVTYALRLMSEEIVKNNTTRVVKRYKDTGDSIITDLLTSKLGSKKKFYKEGSTKGVMDIVVPNMFPLVAIDFIRLSCVSTKYDSSSFVFFENQTGFVLATVEHLFEIGRDSKGDRLFFFDSNVNDDISKNNFRNILAYQHVTSGSPLSSVGRGHVASETTRVDIRTGKIEKKNYKLPEKENSYKYADKTPVGMMTSSFQSDISKAPAEKLLIPFDSSRKENYVLDSIGPRRSFVNLLTQNIIRLLVYGDTTLTVGQVLEAKLPKINGLTGTEDNPSDSQLVSGNYMISKLRHILSNDGGSISHVCAMECVKGSFGESTS